MPPVRNTRELTQQARSRNFLNSGAPQYQTVNRFTQKLMDLQDKLKDVPAEPPRQGCSAPCPHWRQSHGLC